MAQPRCYVLRQDAIPTFKPLTDRLMGANSVITVQLVRDTRDKVDVVVVNAHRHHSPTVEQPRKTSQEDVTSDGAAL